MLHRSESSPTRKHLQTEHLRRYRALSEAKNRCAPMLSKRIARLSTSTFNRRAGNLCQETGLRGRSESCGSIPDGSRPVVMIQVSVVTCCYNDGRFLTRALEALCYHSLPAQQ